MTKRVGLQFRVSESADSSCLRANPGTRLRAGRTAAETEWPYDARRSRNGGLK